LAGEKTGGDERLRSGQTDFSPVAGDPEIAGSSAISVQIRHGSSATTSLLLCDVGGRVDLRDLWAYWVVPASPPRGYAGTNGRLCDTTTLRFSPLVSWW
jgi:hypothetical protein